MGIGEFDRDHKTHIQAEQDMETPLVLEMLTMIQLMPTETRL
jgi:hypothetical protein